MKNYSLSIKLFHRKHCLLVLPFLFLPVLSLPLQTAEAQGTGEDTAHELYQAGSLYGEQNEFTFLGVVQKTPEKGQIGTWVVDGSEVLVSESTAVTGKPGIGSFVELEGIWQGSKNTFKAYDLRVVNGTDPLSTGEFTGTVEEMPTLNWPYGIWIVEGRKINVKKGLELQGKAKAGAKVAVKGSYVDGVFTASEFEVIQ